MRSGFFMASVLALAMTLCGTVYAQNVDKQRLTREQLAEVQAEHIAKEMSMDDKTGERFVETFCRYQREIWALGPRSSGADMSEMTDEEAERAIKERFEHSRKILDIRQKYYEEYSSFLTQSQIRRVYELERRMMNRLARNKKMN